MATESIELYKPWNDKKVSNSGWVSQKLDGVPVRIRLMGGKHLFAYSRQNEVITSIPHILPYARELLEDGGSVTGELHIEGMPFKDISGLVRTEVPNLETAKLVLNLHDFDCTAAPNLSYRNRLAIALFRVAELRERLGCGEHLPLRIIPGVVVRSASEARQAFEAIMFQNPSAEGAVWHDLEKPYRPGMRPWTGMKMLKRPTIDVKVTGFTEAVDKAGRGKDMVGRVEVELHTLYKGNLSVEITGVGPGALTHPERKVLWAQFKQGKYIPKIACIEYKQDDTYNGLREGTFQHWRTDKDYADVRNK